MGNTKTRTRNNRRDRRKAKESGWKRPSKSNSSKIGHGSSKTMTGKKQTNKKQNKKLMKLNTKLVVGDFPTITIGDISQS